ncbi:Serine protease/ABC transporter B family protein tagD [Diplonema papillatum]|nr:Serine protease/ABC transporter B family protein tagD [Diplonema papillatum]
MLGTVVALCLLTEGAGLYLSVPYVQSGTDRRTLEERGITGRGEVLGVVDTGVDYFHCAFWNPAADGPRRLLRANRAVVNHSKVVYLGNRFGFEYQNDTRATSHGTGMTGAAVGNCADGEQARNPFLENGGQPNQTLRTSSFRGMAPAARAAVFSVSRTADGPLELPADLSGVLETLYAAGARVFSLAFCGGGPRGTEALTAFAAARQDAVLVGAAGNKGVEHCALDSPANPRRPAAEGSGGVSLEKAGVEPAELPACASSTVCHPQWSPNVLTVGGTEAVLSARALLGYPNYVVGIRCGLAEPVEFAAYRARFAPFPLHTVPRNQGNQSNQSQSTAAAALPIYPHPDGREGCPGGGRAVSAAGEAFREKHRGEAYAVAAERGACYFAAKALAVPGAALVVVVNDRGFFDGPMESAADDAATYPPTVMVHQRAGRLVFANTPGAACVVSAFAETQRPDPWWTESNVLSMSGRGKVSGGAKGTLRKPDVVAPGEMVLLPRGNTTGGLIPHTGSSAATALVAGGCLLLREALRSSKKNRFALGAVGGLPADPLSALIRGMVAHAAVKHEGVVHYDGRGLYAPLQPGLSPEHDPFQGFGTARLEPLFSNATFLFEGEVAPSDQDGHRICFTIPPSGVGSRLVVTVSWTLPGADQRRRKSHVAGVALRISSPAGLADSTDAASARSNLDRRTVPVTIPGFWAIDVFPPPGLALTQPFAAVVSVPWGAAQVVDSFGCSALVLRATSAAPAAPPRKRSGEPRVGSNQDGRRLRAGENRASWFVLYALAILSVLGLVSWRRRGRAKPVRRTV